jgi:hypothetical protein
MGAESFNLMSMKFPFVCTLFVALSVGGSAWAKQTIARMPVADAKVSGAVAVSDGQVSMSSGASVVAGERGARISLTRGGEVAVCANSAVHVAAGAHPGETTVSLDAGAMELRGTLGQFSDVVLTPDLRILVSGPAAEDVRVRTNQQGDTCVDNVAPGASAGTTGGVDAPYVTVTEQLGTGVYRVQSGQRVMFEHGSVAAVVDHEKEPCGCPPVAENLVAASPAAAGSPGAPGVSPGNAAAAGPKPPEFPLAQSEGLAPAPPPPTEPVVKPGEPHAQVTIPFAYDGSNPPAATAGAAPPPPPPSPAAPTATASTPAAQRKSGGDVWGAVKHFFGKIFGKRSEPAK